MKFLNRIISIAYSFGFKAFLTSFHVITLLNSFSAKSSDFSLNSFSGWLEIALVEKNNKNDEWDERLTVLKETIEYWTNEDNKTEKTVEVIQLFYNQNI